MEDKTPILDSPESLEGISQDDRIIDPERFILLSILSFNLYTVWWAYKTWRFFKYKDNLDIYPALRAIFGIFYLASLFNKIKTYAGEKGHNFEYNSVGLVLV